MMFVMEGSGRTRRKLHLTSYYKSGALSFGVLLFCISQVLRFIQLFRDASARKAANQAPPENYTAAGITWAALIIVLIVVFYILLLRYRKGLFRLPKSRAHMLLSTLFTLWGIYYFVTSITEMIRNSEFPLLFDIAAIAAGILAPVILLQLADIAEDPGNDTALFVCGIGGTALSVISIIVLIVLRKGYANAQLLLVTEFLFRAAMLLCSVAALTKAIQMRRSFPIIAKPQPVRERPVEREPERPKKRVRRVPDEDAPFTLHLDLTDEPEPERPKKRAVKQHVDSLLSYAEQDFEDEKPARVTREKPAYDTRAVQPTWETGRIIVQGGTGRIPTQDPGIAAPSERQTCPYCGKRMPAGFPNCPRCGRDM